MEAPNEIRREAPAASWSDRGLRLGQLLTLLGLTGFAIAQPLLAVAGENPTMFTLADVTGSRVAVFAVLVALIPPLLLWAVVVAVGSVHSRAGDLVFVGCSVILVALTGVQVAKALGFERSWVVGGMGAVAAALFGWLLVRFEPTVVWTRYTSPLPLVAVLILLVASPVSDLLSGPEEIEAAVAGGDHPPVVFVMLDELPLRSLLDEDGNIDSVRYPNLAGFADEATFHTNYTTMGWATAHSIPSILSGRIPTGEEPLWSAFPDNLFTMVAPTHDLVVSERVTRLCGFTNCNEPASSDLSETGIRTLLNQMGEVWRERVSLQPGPGADLGQFAEELEAIDFEASPADDDPAVRQPGSREARPLRVSNFISALERSARPTLHYLHIMLPHQPWYHYPDGAVYEDFPGLIGYRMKGSVTEWDLALLEQAHIMQAQYADRLVGDLLDRLRALDMYDDAVIVVTADHGITFDSYPHFREPSEPVMGDLTFVPLLIKEPGQTRGRVDDSNLMAIDLVPTLGALVGLEPDWEVDGFPRGSAEIEARGSAKLFAMPEPEHRRTIDHIETFDADLHRPVGGERRVGSVESGENPFGGLVAGIGARDLLDTPVADLVLEPGGGGGARVRDRLDDVGADRPGYISGVVTEPGLGDLVLVAVNGTVVSAAPVEAGREFSTLLPSGVVTEGDNDLRLFQVGDQGTVELAVE